MRKLRAMDQTGKEDDLAVNHIPAPQTKQNTSGTTGRNESEKAVPPGSTPKGDYFAWLQVWGTFCLNLNTW